MTNDQRGKLELPADDWRLIAL